MATTRVHNMLSFLWSRISTLKKKKINWELQMEKGSTIKGVTRKKVAEALSLLIYYIYIYINYLKSQLCWTTKLAKKPKREFMKSSKKKKRKKKECCICKCCIWSNLKIHFRLKLFVLTTPGHSVLDEGYEACFCSVMCPWGRLDH